MKGYIIMCLYGTNNCCQNKFYAVSPTFGGNDTTNGTTKPIPLTQEVKQQTELASKECAQATKANALAQISMNTKPNNVPNYKMTPEECVNKLVMSGKVKDKDFKIEEYNNEKTNEAYYVVSELNNNGTTSSRTTFIKDLQNDSQYKLFSIVNLDKETGIPYKSVAYSANGRYFIKYSDSNTGKDKTTEWHNLDGSLDHVDDNTKEKQ